MSLKDLLKLVDDKLEATFNQKPHDAARDRKKIIKGIDRTQTQFIATEPQRGRKWFTTKNSVVRFSPGFAIGGQDTHYVPSERFPDYLKNLRAAVEAGELDDVIGKDAQPVKTRRRRAAAK